MARKSDLPLSVLARTGTFRLVKKINPRSLTVLNYHRIADYQKDGYDTFLPNISASPEMFRQQMDYLSTHYNVISGEKLLAWIQGKMELPPYAAMVTFDDGYQDNWANAYPILKERNLPAIIFLTTNFIDKRMLFYWDKLAYIFRHTQKREGELPLLGKVHWKNDKELYALILAWAEASKLLPNSEKEAALQVTIEALGVPIPDDALSELPLRWNQIREMTENRIEMGSHTVSHPILTRISLKHVREQLADSKKRIEEETGKPVLSFAYPNGGAADFTFAMRSLLEEFDYQLGFSLIPGPVSYADVKKAPYAIRRIFLSHKDTMARFVGKITGLSRIEHFVRR